MSPSSEMHGERLASLETEMKGIRRAMERMTETMERLASSEIRIQQIEQMCKEQKGEAKAHEEEFDLIENRLNNFEQEQKDLKQWIKTRWWVIVTVTTIAATIGGYVMQILIKTVF